MEWSGNMRSLVTRPGPEPFNFLYNYNYDHIPAMEMKHPATMAEGFSMIEKMPYERKKRLTGDQLDSLERSFQDEIKLDPDRKMKLSRELGLQPRQIAVWFQNRRARWKAKHLENLYDALKKEFEAVTREKQRLQEEVLKLRGLLRDEPVKKPVSAGCTDVSGDETVESTSVVLRGSGKVTGNRNHPVAECNYGIGDEYNPASSPYWPLPLVPSYPS